MLWGSEYCSEEAKLALRKQNLLWGGNVARGKQCCSGEVNIALRKQNLLWGSKFALGRQCCSGEAMLLGGSNGGSNVARGKQCCSGEAKLARGKQCCSETRNECVRIRNVLKCVILRRIMHGLPLLWEETHTNMLWGKYALGRRRKFKKGGILENFRKNWREFEKNRGNFRRFCSEKKAI